MGPHASQLLRRIREFRLDDRIPSAAQLRARIEHGRLQEWQAQRYMPWVDALVQEFIDHPNLLHRPPTAEEFHADAQPDIEFASLCEADVRCGIRLLDGPRHVIAAGHTGSGKTTAMRGISVGTAHTARKNAHRLSQIVFDRKGGEYGDLPQALGPEWLHLSVHDGMRLGLNAPGIPSDVWIEIVSGILAVHLGLISSKVCLASVLRFLVAALNPRPTKDPLWPDLRLVLEVLRNSRLEVWASKTDYGKTLVQALEGVVQSSGPLTQTLNGLDVNRDVIDQGKSVVIEMSNLEPASLRSIVLDLILAQVFYRRLHRHHLVDATEVLLLMDEADEDVSRDAEKCYPRRMSVINRILKQGRELGIMAAIGVTLLRNTSDYVLSGAQYQLIFNQPDAESMTAARRTLATSPASEQMFPALSRGQMIFRQAQAEWPHPVLCQVDYYPPRRTETPDSYDRHSFVPSRTFDELPHVRAALKEHATQWNKGKLRRGEQAREALSANARKLLELASLNPYVPVSRLWEQMKLASASAQRAARKNLEEAELAEFATAQIGSPTFLLIEIQAAGWEFLRKPVPKRLGRGGVTHRNFAHWIHRVGRLRSHQSKLEWKVPGTNHPVDVAWMIGDRWHVFEVSATCRENLTSHLRTCLNATGSVEHVTIIAENRKVLRELERKLRDEFVLDPLLDRVSFESIEPYMKELFR